jgi:hypothetical protein
VKILVLGSGPAGLLAAHAASYAEGAEVKILSRKQPSGLFGCQYLHGPIPGLDLRTTTVRYQRVGTDADYAQKVYGTTTMANQVSPATLVGTHPAWDIRQAYGHLTNRYWDQIEELDITPDVVDSLLHHLDPDLVISSIPAFALCQQLGNHAFSEQRCWALGDAADRGQTVPVPCPDDTIICNGDVDTGWYRVSRVFGQATAEWPGWRPKPPLKGVVGFSKPLATTCDCWPGFLRVGRYGTWTKGELAHHAFAKTVKRLTERVRGL